jgi:hypothetical protein
VSEYVRDEPLTAVAIAGVAGFVLGGGVNRRLGLAMLTMVSRIALRAVATSMFVGMITGDYDSGRYRGDGDERAKPSDGGHDNRRTDFQEPE